VSLVWLLGHVANKAHLESLRGSKITKASDEILSLLHEIKSSQANFQEECRDRQSGGSPMLTKKSFQEDVAYLRIDKERNKFLDWLGQGSHAEHEEANECRDNESGDWLIGSQEFREWINQESSSFFWLNGIRMRPRSHPSKPNANFQT